MTNLPDTTKNRAEETNVNTAFYNDIKNIITDAKVAAVRSVDFQRVMMYWRMGERIFVEEQKGEKRAEYGTYLIKNLSKVIEPEFGSGFSVRQLERARQFYRAYPITSALRTQFNWMQYRLLIQIDDPQKRLLLEDDEFFADLVFYNRLLRCFVVIEIKTHKITHADLGQLQMYVNYFDRFEKLPDENPTVGVLLCTDKNDALVKITLPEDNKNILTSKYQLYIPSENDLLKEIKAVIKNVEEER